MGGRSPAPRNSPPAVLLPLGYLGLTLSFVGVLAGDPWGLLAMLLGTASTAAGALSFVMELAGERGASSQR
jgi:hypothetical protein